MDKLIFILVLLMILCILSFVKNEYFINTNMLEIKKITPQINYNISAEIIFVSVYTPNILNYAKHSIINLMAYAKKYNYGVIIYNQQLNDNVYPCWNKIASILVNLSKCKYLVWIDADAIISNFSVPIDTFIKKDPKKDLYLCNDIYIDKECINSGVMIIKNTEWSYNLFKKVWFSEIPHHHNDQNVIWLEIMKEIDPNVSNELYYPKYCKNLEHPKVLLLPEKNFNSNIYNYTLDDFILHLMGVNMDSRINIMRQINTKLGLDNYDEIDCLEAFRVNFSGIKRNLIDKICFKKNNKKLNLTYNNKSR